MMHKESYHQGDGAMFHVQETVNPGQCSVTEKEMEKPSHPICGRSF